MFWIVIALLIIAGYVIYHKRKTRGSVTLTGGQAEMVSELVAKQRKEIAKETMNILDKGALQGKTVPVENICKDTTGMTDETKREVGKAKEELLERYGPTIPVNTAQRLQWELEGRGPMWSERPGCFERHLQRRDGNLLFPKERRIVTQEEIEEARQRDTAEQQQFLEKVRSFEARSALASRNGLTLAEIRAVLGETQKLLEEGASIAGVIDDILRALEHKEEELMKLLSEAMPSVVDGLQTIHSLCFAKRRPFMAQLVRKDSPIHKEEEAPTLLSEDLATISFQSYIIAGLDPDFRPNESDIKGHLEHAVSEGFSTKRAESILAAWNEGKERWIKSST